MSVAALDMLHLALDAFVRWDDDQADDVLGRDDEVDRHCAWVISAMTAHMSRDASDMQAGCGSSAWPSTSSESPTTPPTSPRP